MSWVEKTTAGGQYLAGGQSVQLRLPDDDDRVYEHFHFDGNTSLNGATATLRSRGWIRSNELVTVIRSCDPLVTESPSAHLVVIRSEDGLKKILQKEKERARPRRSDPLRDAIEGWNRLIQFVDSGSKTF